MPPPPPSRPPPPLRPAIRVENFPQSRPSRRPLVGFSKRSRHLARDARRRRPKSPAELAVPGPSANPPTCSPAPASAAAICPAPRHVPPRQRHSTPPPRRRQRHRLLLETLPPRGRRFVFAHPHALLVLPAFAVAGGWTVREIPSPTAPAPPVSPNTASAPWPFSLCSTLLALTWLLRAKSVDRSKTQGWKLRHPHPALARILLRATLCLLLLCLLSAPVSSNAP